MKKPFHPYYLIQELCTDLGYEVKLMAGALDFYTTFVIVRDHDVGFRVYKKMVLHGSVLGTTVTLGIGMAARKEFDLRDPDSISKIKEYIKSDPPWRLASR